MHISGGLAYVSGHLPVDGADVLMTGRVGSELELEQGYEAARLTGLSIFASLEQELGDLDRVTSWVKALGLVQCAPGSTSLRAVHQRFHGPRARGVGRSGGPPRPLGDRAARASFDVPVEVEAVVEIA